MGNTYQKSARYIRADTYTLLIILYTIPTLFANKKKKNVPNYSHVSVIALNSNRIPFSFFFRIFYIVERNLKIIIFVRTIK